MAWQIHLLENNVTINKKIADEIEELIEKKGYLEIPFLNNSKLYFCSDAYEHKDYLSDYPEIIDILCRHKIYGRITFGDLEGDNAPKFWGYQFDGKGHYCNLRGEVNWNVESEE